MGRSTRGVRGVNLKDADFVIDMETVNESSTILTVTENGYGKRTPVAKYRKTRRGSSGVINIKIVEDNGPVVGMLETTTGEEGDIVLLTQTGMIIRTSVAAISETGRNTIGRILIRLNANDKVIGISHVEKEVNKETIYKTSSSTGEGEEIIDDDAPVDDIVEDDVLEDEEPKAGK